MAHQIVQYEGFYTITYDPLLDWDSANVFPNGMRVMTIEMAPHAANDAVVVRNGQNGPRVFSHEAIDTYDIAVRPYRDAVSKGENGRLMFPYIANGEATGAFEITFELA